MKGFISRFSARGRAHVGAAASRPDEGGVGAAPLAVVGGRSLPPALAGLLGNLDQPIFVLDDRGFFAGASEPLLRLLGITQERLRGLTASEVFHADPGLVANCQAGPVRFRDSSGGEWTGRLSIKAVPGAASGGFRVGLLTTTTSGRHQPAVSRTSPPPPGSAGRFTGAIKEKLKAKAPPHQLTAGRIELISLDEVKEALGQRWAAQAERARSIAKSVLERRLAAEDVFTEVEDGVFLVCFSSVSEPDPKVLARAESS